MFFFVCMYVFTFLYVFYFFYYFVLYIFFENNFQLMFINLMICDDLYKIQKKYFNFIYFFIHFFILIILFKKNYSIFLFFFILFYSFLFFFILFYSFLFGTRDENLLLKPRTSFHKASMAQMFFISKGFFTRYKRYRR